MMDGYFASEESLLRRVHGERAVGLFYGQRLTCVGAANPRIYVATALHSKRAQKPFARLARTAEVMETVIFASQREADRALGEVAAVHAEVRGVLPVDAGVHPTGTYYSALDPELMLWVLAVLADSAQCFFELLVCPLSATQKEALWRDYLRLGELFGMPHTVAPASYVEFRDWWQERLASIDLHLTVEAHQTGYAMTFQLPMPAYASRLLRPAHNALLLGSLPPQVRDLYGLAYTTEDDARFQRAIRAIRTLRRHCPDRLAHGSSRWFYSWIAREEERRIKHGRPTPHLNTPVLDGSARAGGQRAAGQAREGECR